MSRVALLINVCYLKEIEMKTIETTVWAPVQANVPKVSIVEMIFALIKQFMTALLITTVTVILMVGYGVIKERESMARNYAVQLAADKLLIEQQAKALQESEAAKRVLKVKLTVKEKEAAQLAAIVENSIETKVVRAKESVVDSAINAKNTVASAFESASDFYGSLL